MFSLTTHIFFGGPASSRSCPPPLRSSLLPHPQTSWPGFFPFPSPEPLKNPQVFWSNSLVFPGDCTRFPYSDRHLKVSSFKASPPPSPFMSPSIPPNPSTFPPSFCLFFCVTLLWFRSKIRQCFALPQCVLPSILLFSGLVPAGCSHQFRAAVPQRTYLALPAWSTVFLLTPPPVGDEKVFPHHFLPFRTPPFYLWFLNLPGQSNFLVLSWNSSPLLPPQSAGDWTSAHPKFFYEF